MLRVESLTESKKISKQMSKYVQRLAKYII